MHPFEVFNLLQQGNKKWIMFDADPDIATEGYKLVDGYRKQYGKNAHARDWFNKEIALLTQKIKLVYECNQQPGDIIYIPVNYCHAVLNGSESMGLIVEINR
jgi:oxalate decarboxylase/phosphoglucose isomerase-like protein (cupin superfamily)